MTRKEIDEFIGREVMGWTLRRSKNPKYDWWVDGNGSHGGLARNWKPSQHYFGLCDCFRVIDKLAADGFTHFKLEHISCVGGFTWAASINGWISGPPGIGVKEVKKFFGGAGKTAEESICSMAISIGLLKAKIQELQGG